ncbi:MAG TPA: hypothetical protein VMG59_13890 [Phycisphaerae bacterium]|nr:hypothetical protein [Phycisphaerae bacterium]
MKNQKPRMISSRTRSLVIASTALTGMLCGVVGQAKAASPGTTVATPTTQPSNGCNGGSCSKNGCKSL